MRGLPGVVPGRAAAVHGYADAVIVVLLPHAVFGLVVRDGAVVLAPPISRRSLGRPARQVWDYYARRGRVLWLP